MLIESACCCPHSVVTGCMGHQGLRAYISVRRHTPPYVYDAVLIGVTMPRPMLCRGLPLLLLCFLASTERVFAATAPSCTTLHPQCTSCATTTKTTVSGAKISYLACTACKGPTAALAKSFKTYTNFGVNPPKSPCSE
jgi:hypothetical protein